MVTKHATMSDGQAVLIKVAEWISSWVVFPEMPARLDLVCALWAMHTWFSPRWPATTYAHITSDGPGCGKTTLMEVLARLSLRPRNRATLRALAVVRDIQEQGSAVTYFFDQVEALHQARKVSDEQAILLTGYRYGGEHGISVGAQQIAFSTYCSKMFASIGDIASDLRSRCIVVPLTYGVPSRVWTDEVMVRDDEAALLKTAMASVGVRFDAPPTWTPPEWLHGRDREIWTPIWSTAVALKLDATMMATVRTAIDQGIKSKALAEPKSYRNMLAGQLGDQAAALAAQALKDLAAVMPIPGPKGKAGVPTGDLSSERAVALMIERDVTWKMYRGGRGLDAVALASLVSKFSLGTEVVREKRGRAAKALNGYRAEAVRAAVAIMFSWAKE